ncbi:MAG: phosphodiester glycosidase family protein [Candidatus Aureabacteria bacterium]|nr:phosphodiester glycosidase family protein [Candidatus Auribacterota bacterium]
MRCLKIFFCFLWFIFFSLEATAENLCIEKKLIEKGLSLKTYRIDDEYIYLLELDRKNTSLKFSYKIAGNSIYNSLETIDKISLSISPVVAMNASYFGYPYNELPTGELRGFVINENEVISSYDPFEKNDTLYLVIYPNKIGLFHPEIKIGLTFNDNLFKDYPVFINNIGRYRDTQGIYIYTHKISKKLPNWIEKAYLYRLNKNMDSLYINKEHQLEYVKKIIDPDEFEIKKGDIIITASKKAMLKLESLVEKSKKVSLKFEHNFESDVTLCLMGLYSIIKNGNFDITDGVTKESEKRLLAGLVDDDRIIFVFGKMNLHHLKEIIKDNNIKDGLLLDGGGSTSLVIKNNILYGCRRKVADCLMLTK